MLTASQAISAIIQPVNAACFSPNCTCIGRHPARHLDSRPSSLLESLDRRFRTHPGIASCAPRLTFFGPSPASRCDPHPRLVRRIGRRARDEPGGRGRAKQGRPGREGQAGKARQGRSGREGRAGKARQGRPGRLIHPLVPSQDCAASSSRAAGRYPLPSITKQKGSPCSSAWVRTTPRNSLAACDSAAPRR